MKTYNVKIVDGHHVVDMSEPYVASNPFEALGLLVANMESAADAMGEVIRKAGESFNKGYNSH